MNRDEQLEVIFDRLDSYYRVFEMTLSRIEYAKTLVADGEDIAVEALAAAIASDAQFTGNLLEDLMQNHDLKANAVLAMIYDPQLHEGRSRFNRKRLINLALDQYLISDMSIPPQFYGTEARDFGFWKLFTEDSNKRIRAKRFVAMECALEYCIVTDSVRYELRNRTLDDSRTDHESLLKVLRQHSGRNLTLEQLEFILRGGPRAVAAGVL